MALLRYAIAVLLVVAVPAAIGYWLLIHPFVRFWRRHGPRTAYLAVLPVIAAIMAGMFLLRSRLLGLDGGTNWPLVGLGSLFLVLSGWLRVKLGKRLTVRILVGVPELSAAPGEMLSDGLYTRIRHPRYLQMTLALLGYALIANYPAAYAAFLCWCAGIALVIRLEERELRDRFGAPYRDYCQRVPCFLPRIRRPFTEP
jgi:protein-S-isoprenylcysteine O-methyltransferase Ste14